MQKFTRHEPTSARRRLVIVCVDSTDGVTPETGLSFSAGDVKISKNGAAEANHAGSFTELAGGLYYYEFTAGELDTLGFITLRVLKSGVRAATFLGEVRAEPDLISAAVSDVSPAAGDFDTDLTSSTNDFHKDAYCAFVTGSLAGQVRKVTGYTGSTKNLQFSSAFTGAPSNADKFVIINS